MTYGWLEEPRKRADLGSYVRYSIEDDPWASTRRCWRRSCFIYIYCLYLCSAFFIHFLQQPFSNKNHMIPTRTNLHHSSTYKYPFRIHFRHYAIQFSIIFVFACATISSSVVAAPLGSHLTQDVAKNLETRKDVNRRCRFDSDCKDLNAPKETYVCAQINSPFYARVRCR